MKCCDLKNKLEFFLVPSTQLSICLDVGTAPSTLNSWSISYSLLVGCGDVIEVSSNPQRVAPDVSHYKRDLIRHQNCKSEIRLLEQCSETCKIQFRSLDDVDSHRSLRLWSLYICSGKRNSISKQIGTGKQHQYFDDLFDKRFQETHLTGHRLIGTLL